MVRVIILQSFTTPFNPQAINAFRVKDFVFAILHPLFLPLFFRKKEPQNPFTFIALKISGLYSSVKEVKDKNTNLQ